MGCRGRAGQPRQGLGPRFTTSVVRVSPLIVAVRQILARRPLSLSDHFASGEQLRRLQAELGNWGRVKGWRKAVAAAVGTSESTLNKCLQLRESYEPDELPEL